MEAESWFSVEEIDRTTFAISEYKHWEETHCYLLCGTERAMLIDTGLGVSNIRRVIDSLTRLPVLVVTTHAHWDHIGGHRYFDAIAIHEAEKDWLAGEFPLPRQAVINTLTSKPCEFPEGFEPETYRIFRGTPGVILTDGERLELGGRQVQVIHTPGHSPGHCCLYERDRGYLYTGDLIYRGCLDMFYPTTDPLLFYRSVQRIRTVEAGRILPGHHALEVPVDIVGRIEQAFYTLEAEGKLTQGSGIFDFGEFRLHL